MKKKLHLICNAHIDPIWQWNYDEGMASTIATFKSALELLEEYDFVFCHNESILYEYVEKHAPQLFARIKEKIAEGKWKIMGGWYLQPDCTMVSGEGLVRQIQAGRKYFREKFSTEPTTALNLDSFGHTKGLVQILEKTGFESYLFTRPHKAFLSLPEEQFIWRGFNGSKVKAVRVQEYSSLMGETLRMLKERVDFTQNYVQVFLWGVGNHGGGPSRKDLDDLAAYAEEIDFEMVHSYPEKFFSEIKPTKEFSNSLTPVMVGGYSSMYDVKKLYRRLENELFMTEQLATNASQSGFIYPTQRFAEAERVMLLAQFHDVLPGTIIQQAKEDAIGEIYKGLRILADIRTDAFMHMIINDAVAQEGEYPIFVYNYLPYAIKQTIEVEFLLANQNWEDDRYITNVEVYDGEILLKSQMLKENSNINLDWRKKVVFTCELQPTQINRFTIKTRLVERQKGGSADVSYRDDCKQVLISSKSGCLFGYKRNGKEYLNGEMALYLYDDVADTWGMNKLYIGEKPEKFHLMTEEESAEFCGYEEGYAPLRVIEDGDVMKCIEAFFAAKNTKARVRYKIFKEQDYVDVDIDVFLNDRNKAVKLVLPTAMKAARMIGDTAYGEDNLLQDGTEQVTQKYVALSEDKTLALINNGTYGCSSENGEIRMTLLRGTIYCLQSLPGREPYSKDRYYESLEQGRNSFSFRIYGGDKEEIPARAMEFNQPSYALNVFPIGQGNTHTSFIEITNKSILLAAAKCNEDDGMIIRLFNQSEQKQETEVRFLGYTATYTFTPYEIKTVRYAEGKYYEEKILIV